MDDKPLPHPPYSDEYVLPKTRYGVPVRLAQFVSVSNILEKRNGKNLRQNMSSLWRWLRTAPGSFERAGTQLPSFQYTELA